MKSKKPDTSLFDTISEDCRNKVIALVIKHAQKHPENPWNGRPLVELEKTIRAFYAKIGKRYNGAFREELPEFAKYYYDRAKQEIKQAGVYQQIHLKPDTEQIQHFLDSAYDQVAMRTTKMTADHIRQLRSISAEVFRETSVTGETVREISKRLLDKALQIPNFEFIDNEGKKWANKSYFTMLARTELMNAANEIYSEKMAEEHFDIMRLGYGGNKTCTHCAKYEGKLFSLTGATPDLPTLDDLKADGVFHPNCTHSYNLVPDAVLEEMGLDIRQPEPPIEN